MEQKKQWTKKNNGWHELGTLRRKSPESSPYLILNPGVQILVDGVEVDLGKFRTIKLLDPVKKIDGSLEKGYITEEQAEERKQAIVDKSIKYNVTVAPPQNDQN